LAVDATTLALGVQLSLLSLQMSDPYSDVKAHFSVIDGVTVNEGRGSQGLKLGNKMFVMFYKSQLIVKLPPERIAELVTAGDGMPFDPGTGKPMKDRVLIQEERKNLWITFCEESRRYAESQL